jgi:uncharacterized protein
MILFEWDAAKARANARQHGVNFEDAMLVSLIPMRWLTRIVSRAANFGGRPSAWVGDVVILVVAHTVREQGEDEIIRILSARKAERKERKRYDENCKKDSF